MLVLSRQPGKAILIGDGVRLTLVEIRDHRVVLVLSVRKRGRRSSDHGSTDWVKVTRQLAMGETIPISNNVEVTLVDVNIDRARLGTESPPDMPIHRKEAWDAIQRENETR